MLLTLNSNIFALLNKQLYITTGNKAGDNTKEIVIKIEKALEEIFGIVGLEKIEKMKEAVKQLPPKMKISTRGAIRIL